jgi:hypothetical protein
MVEIEDITDEVAAVEAKRQDEPVRSSKSDSEKAAAAADENSAALLHGILRESQVQDPARIKVLLGKAGISVFELLSDCQRYSDLYVQSKLEKAGLYSYEVSKLLPILHAISKEAVKDANAQQANLRAADAKEAASASSASPSRPSSGPSSRSTTDRSTTAGPDGTTGSTGSRKLWVDPAVELLDGILGEAAVTNAVGKKELLKKAKISVLDLLADHIHLGELHVGAKLRKNAEMTFSDVEKILPVLRKRCTDGVCLGCGKTKGTKACSRCKIAHFCDQECQRKAWPCHKDFCSATAHESKMKLEREFPTVAPPPPAAPVAPADARSALNELERLTISFNRPFVTSKIGAALEGEKNKPPTVKRVAAEGLVHGKLQVGDTVLGINGITARGATHVQSILKEAVGEIKIEVGRQRPAGSAPAVSREDDGSKFPNGTTIKVHGLTSRREVNGHMGQVLNFDAPSGRYVVLVGPTGAKMKLKAANLMAATETQAEKMSRMAKAVQVGHVTAEETLQLAMGDQSMANIMAPMMEQAAQMGQLGGALPGQAGGGAGASPALADVD